MYSQTMDQASSSMSISKVATVKIPLISHGRLAMDRFWQGLAPIRWSHLGLVVLPLVLVWVVMVPVWAAPITMVETANQVQRQEQETTATDEGFPPNGGPADASDIPSETVSRFVEAYLAVVELIESKEASLQRAETDTESQQMQEEIQRQAMGVIQDHGLTLQAYWELLGLANSDDEFRERVLAQVEEASL